MFIKVIISSVISTPYRIPVPGKRSRSIYRIPVPGKRSLLNKERLISVVSENIKLLGLDVILSFPLFPFVETFKNDIIKAIEFPFSPYVILSHTVPDIDKFFQCRGDGVL